MEELAIAIEEGCNRVAIFYGSGHLPDMDRRLRNDFGLRPVEREWRTAWAIRNGRPLPVGPMSDALAGAARISGWPLNRYQTMAVLLGSLFMAADLYFWELLLNSLEDYAEQTIVTVVTFLDAGWGL
eukprot:TRINITY_DN4335_c0_g4_i1.p1 TRINITY_DN4335_c0_g4~~TRINITY_DN4335_c0_g4_i1.p1  ORF type:complete len:139 (+),score=22.06 TRINITY_DN4335_c0_g4_i1:39-419(+)